MRPRTLALSLVAAGALGGAHLLAAAAFRGRARALAAGLGAAGLGTAGSNADVGLDPAPPAIVRAFAARAAPAGGVPRVIRLRQRAEMRAAPGDPWRRHTAEQTIGVREPGFVWLARVRLAPFVWARVLDAHAGGEGRIEVRLFDSVRLARAAGPQVGRGELMRYLAELAWAPQAMLHNPRLRWRELDAATVEVSAESAGGPARVRLVFEGDDLARIEADDRPRAVGRGTVPTPWRGCFSDYREMGGCRIPTRAEVAWLLGAGPFTCWRGEVTAFESR